MSTWILYQGDTQLAVIKKTGIDFPWYIGQFKPYPAFTPYHSLFIKSCELLEADDFYSPTYEQIYQAIEALTLSIYCVDTQQLFNDVLLNLYGSEVGWRCAEERMS